MQQGIVSRAIRRRTVEKEIHSQHKVYHRPLVSRSRLLLTAEELPDLFEEVQGAMLEKGAAVREAMIQVSLPVQASETDLRTWMRGIDATLEAYQWKLADLQVRAEQGLQRAQVAIAGSGERFAESEEKPFVSEEVVMEQAMEQAAVYLLGYPGSAGASRIYRKMEKDGETVFHGRRYIAVELSALSGQRFGRLLTDYLAGRTDYPAGRKEDRVIALGEGGLFSAIYQLAHSLSDGLVIDLTAVPITAATVALCERENIDPYRLWSIGCFLIVTKQKTEIEAWAVENGLPLKVIGEVTPEQSHCLKRIRSDSSIEKPSMDELYRWQEERG